MELTTNQECLNLRSSDKVRRPAKSKLLPSTNSPAFILSILDMDRDEGVKRLKQYLVDVNSSETASVLIVVAMVLLEWCVESGWKEEGNEIIRQCFAQQALKPFMRNFKLYIELRWNKCLANMSYNKRKQLPMSGQGVIAQAPKNGMQTTLTWLKSIRLHKYWPLISNLTYGQLLSMTNATFDDMVSSIGASPVTKGARDKFIKQIKTLQWRREVALLPQETDDQILLKIEQLEWIVKTPLSSDPDPDGTYLLPQLRKALSDVSDAVLLKTENVYVLEQLLDLYERITYNEVLKETVTEVLEMKISIEEKKNLLKNYYNGGKTWPLGKNQVTFKSCRHPIQIEEESGLLQEDMNSYFINNEELLKNITILTDCR